MLTADAPRADSPFAALRGRNYRIYLSGQSLANTGSWIQSIAQDWLVLHLTGSSTAVGITMALQYGPILLLGAHTGLIADRFPKRRILLATQMANAILTACLAVLTIRGMITVSEVYAFALTVGLVFAVDSPARQSFISEVVPNHKLRGAISLNAAVFQATRLVGPAIAGLLISTVGTGWAFAINASLYVGPTIGLLRLRGLTPRPPAPRQPRAIRGAVEYVLARPRVAWTILLVGTMGSFGLNFPVVLTAMAKSTFHGNASTYGIFNIAVAIGSVGGALLAGSGLPNRLRLIVFACAGFGLAESLAALAPDYTSFLVVLVAMGMVNLAFQAMANASVQLWIDPAMRGRVMGLYMLVFVGGTPIGAPTVGAITNAYGPRVGMLVCGLFPLVAATSVAFVHRRAARPVLRSA